MSFDLTTALVIMGGLAFLFLVVDVLLAGGGMTGALMGGVMHCGAAMMSSPYGWGLALVLLLIVLAVLGLVWGFR